MTAALMPWPRVKFFVNNTNAPLSGGKVYTYAAGTSTPLVTYQDTAAAVPNTNPVILDSNGEASILLGSGLSYKINVLDASNVQVPGYPIDNVSASDFAALQLRYDLANTSNPALGAALVGYTDPLTATYLKTVSDIINGEEVSLFRFIPTTKHAGIYARTNTDDLATYFNDAFTGVASGGRGRIRAPAGLYNSTAFTMPTGVKSFRGVGASTTIQAIGAYSANTAMFNVSSVIDVDLGDFALSMDKATYTTQQALKFTSCIGGVVSNIHIPKSGNFAVYSNACGSILFDNIKMDDYITIGFYADGSPTFLQARRLFANFAGASHGIQISGGTGHDIAYSYGTSSGAFGINLNGASNSAISNCMAVAPTYEGVQLTDCYHTNLINNRVFCNPGHADFGISIHGSTADCYQGVIQGNRVYNSGKAGIALAATASYRVAQFEVCNNLIISPNRLNQAQWAGVTLYGSALCKDNDVHDNTCIDEGNYMLYGVNEYNDGTGIPNNNTFTHNRTLGNGLLGEALIIGSTSEVTELRLNTFTPAVTSTGGTITTVAASPTLKYKRRGKFIDVDVSFGITTNGTGSGAIQLTTPWTTLAGGALSGRANAVSGKAVNAYISPSVITIYNYDNTYPGANGETFKLSGILELS